MLDVTSLLYLKSCFIRILNNLCPSFETPIVRFPPAYFHSLFFFFSPCSIFLPFFVFVPTQPSVFNFIIFPIFIIRYLSRLSFYFHCFALSICRTMLHYLVTCITNAPLYTCLPLSFTFLFLSLLNFLLFRLAQPENTFPVFIFHLIPDKFYTLLGSLLSRYFFGTFSRRCVSIIHGTSSRTSCSESWIM